MDINHKRRESNITIAHPEEKTEISPAKTNKRPFDVAFLMLPDEKLKQKQLKAKFEEYHQVNGVDISNNNDSEVYDKTIDHEEPFVTRAEPNRIHPKLIHNPQKTQIFDDPNLGKPKTYEIEDYRVKPNIDNQEQKSAFTKVNLTKDHQRLSPNLSISPDLSYQNSLSPSPPIVSNRQYQSFPPNILSPNQIFKTQHSYQSSFLQESPSTSIDPFLVKPNQEMLQQNFSKIRPMLQYRPEIPYLANSYPTTFQNQELLKIQSQQSEISRTPAAAAILTSLLPPSLAALSLPAQNICAKCNISFRMTSDLVYHMRSHHKNDVVNDYSKRRREEKLKCPVCSESFRERHHLTRHMTAHQDKEGDSIETPSKKKGAYFKQ